MSVIKLLVSITALAILITGCSDESSTSSESNNVFVSISAGAGHTCGLRTDGSVECWGYNFVGQSIPPDGSFKSVSAGFNHTCGVKTDGSLECWGNDEIGQSSPPAGSFTSVSAGGYHTCGLNRTALLNAGAMMNLARPCHLLQSSLPSAPESAIPVD